MILEETLEELKEFNGKRVKCIEYDEELPEFITIHFTDYTSIEIQAHGNLMGQDGEIGIYLPGRQL